MKRTISLVAVGMVLVLVGCGGGSGSKATTVTTASSSNTTLSAGPIAGSSTTTAGGAKTVGQSVTFAGFKVTVDMATLAPSASGTGSLLTLDATFENQGTDPRAFSSSVSVNSHGVDFPDDGSGTLPNVPGGGKNKGTLKFTVDQQFTLADAVVTFGKPDETQAKVPLGSTGSLVALTPVAVSGLPTSVTVTTFTLALKSGEARADQVTEHQEAAKGHWYVYLKGSAAFSGAASGMNFGPDGVSLKLPDGTSVVGEAADSKSCCFALYPGQPPADFTFRFLVADPPSGSYAGTLKIKVGGTESTGSFTLTVPTLPSGSGTSTTTATGSTTSTT